MDAPGLTAERSRPELRAAIASLQAVLTDERVLLVAILLLATALRLVAIGSRLNIDDAYSWLVGSAPSGHVFLTRLAGSENTPPLFYLLLAPLPLGHAAWLRVPAAIPGILMCAVTWYALRRPLGTRAALLAALGVAVAPLLVTYSNLARGFMLEDLVLLIALWAVLRLAEGGSSRWWWAYLASGVVAIYTEYDSALFLLALTGAAVWIGLPDRRRTAILGPLPLLAIAPWIPQIVSGQNAVGITKLSPTFPGPSATSLRDVVVTLALGEYGGTKSSTGRWLEFAAFLVLAAAAAFLLARAVRSASGPYRRAIVMIALTGALTLIAHAIAGALGFDVFNQRYLTILIPLTAALGAAALLSTERRAVIALASVALVGVGIANLARRYHHQWEPSLAPVKAAALRLHPRTILTDSPVVVYYLSSLRPQLDRPFDLGPGRGQSCTRPCLIIDDLSIHTGSRRRLLAPATVLGRFQLSLER